MAKIIEIMDNTITVGFEDGTMQEVRRIDCNFVPQLGDEVEIFSSESRTIVQKKEKVNAQSTEKSGININLTNSQSTPTMVYSTKGKVVNKLSYCLFAAFLGGIGAHKFYAGKIAEGIIYLLFCWTFIPSFIAFIEFIIGLCKEADSAGNIII